MKISALINKLAEARSKLQNRYANLIAENLEKRIPRAAGLSISFDDAYVDEWFSIRPVFDRYKVKATFFVSNFDLLTDDKIEKLKILRSDGHEIAFHGLRHLNANKFAAENSVSEYLAAEILPGIKTMVSRGFAPITFSYPYGCRSARLDWALLQYFSHVRGVANANNGKNLCDQKSIFYKSSSGLLFGAGIDNIYKTSIQAVQDALKKAAAQNSVLLLFAHRTSSEEGNYCTPAAKLDAIFKSVSEMDLKFYRIKDL
ncbi:MAG: polysaccharide deacetylase family protein [Actinomycetota bacterium]|nr:polysaccharide deacetylase family protein [Actinomycetota bacterium]